MQIGTLIRKPLALVVLGAVLVGVAALAVVTRGGGDDCEWVSELRFPQPEPGTQITLTEEDVDRVVANVPGEVKGTVRTIFDSARELQERTRALSELPTEEQAEVAQEIVSDYQESFPPAIEAFQEYVSEHCPGLTSG